MNHFKGILAATTALALLGMSASAMAECGTLANETQAQQKNDEVVADARTDPETGDKEASTGSAKPTENWFGCNPDKDDFKKCVSAKGKQQENEAAQQKAASGKAAEKPAAPAAENGGNATGSDVTSSSRMTTAEKSDASGDCTESKDKG